MISWYWPSCSLVFPANCPEAECSMRGRESSICSLIARCLGTIIGAMHRGVLLLCMGAHRDRVHTLIVRATARGLPATRRSLAGFCLGPLATLGGGLNEHANGLVREYFPKGADLSQITAEALARPAVYDA